MIDRHKMYGAIIDYGLGKMAKQIGVAESTLHRKLKSPTEKLYAVELFQICQILQPESEIKEAIAAYLS